MAFGLAGDSRLIAFVCLGVADAADETSAVFRGTIPRVGVPELGRYEAPEVAPAPG